MGCTGAVLPSSRQDHKHHQAFMTLDFRAYIRFSSLHTLSAETAPERSAKNRGRLLAQRSFLASSLPMLPVAFKLPPKETPIAPLSGPILQQ